MLHLCTQSEGDAETFAGVEYTCSEIQRLLVEGSTEAGVEHILRIIAVIAHLSLEQRLHGVRTEREADGVELNAGSYQRVETDGTVDATLGGERHVDKGVLIVVTEMTYGTGEDVLLSCVQIERELRQTFADATD